MFPANLSDLASIGVDNAPSQTNISRSSRTFSEQLAIVHRIASFLIVGSNAAHDMFMNDQRVACCVYCRSRHAPDANSMLDADVHDSICGCTS